MQTGMGVVTGMGVPTLVSDSLFEVVEIQASCNIEYCMV